MKAAIIDDLAACRGEIRACLNHYLDENYAGETPVIEQFDALAAHMDETRKARRWRFFSGGSSEMILAPTVPRPQGPVL